MTALVVIPFAVVAVIAAAGIWLNHACRRPDPGTRWLGAPPALDPESALLIQQAEADAERESLDRLRGIRPALALAPLPEGYHAGPVRHAGRPPAGWTPNEGGPPWPASGNGHATGAAPPALPPPAPRPATLDATARPGPAVSASTAGFGVSITGSPASPETRPPGPDETGERLLHRARVTLRPGETPKWARDIVGHDDNAAAVESMFTRAMAAQVAGKVNADG